MAAPRGGPAHSRALSQAGYDEERGRGQAGPGDAPWDGPPSTRLPCNFPRDGEEPCPAQPRPVPRGFPSAPGKPSVVREAERQPCAGTLPARAWPRLPSLCVLDLAIAVFWALRTGAGTQALLSRCLMSKYIQVNSSRAEAKLFT